MDLRGLLIFDQVSNIKSPGRSIDLCQTSSLVSPDPLPWARARTLQTCIPGVRCSRGRSGPWAQQAGKLVREPLSFAVARAAQASSAQVGNPPIQPLPSAAVASSWAAGPSSKASEPYAAAASSAVVAAANEYCSTVPTASRAAIQRRHTPGGSSQCLGGRVPTAVASSWAAGPTSSRAADEASWAAAASCVGG
jgi:hypothetical protein